MVLVIVGGGTYRIEFPFTLPPGQEITGVEQTYYGTLDGRPFNLSGSGSFYVVRFFDINSEEEAQAQVQRLWAGFAWVLLNRGIAFSQPGVLQTVVSNSPGITVWIWPPQTPEVQSDFVTEVYPLLVEGGASSGQIDAKLRTAIELYSAHFYEQSDNAKFLTLVIALEALTTPQDKHFIALEQLDQFRKELARRKGGFDHGSQEQRALASLEGELNRLKQTSIKEQLRALVCETLVSSVEPGRLEEYAKRVGEVYDKRSKLVHDGVLPPDDLKAAMRDAKEIAQLVLKAKLQPKQDGS